MKRLMVIEDDPILRAGLIELLNGIEPDLIIYESGSGREGLRMAKENAIDAFFLDVELEDPHYTGIDLAKDIRQEPRYEFSQIVFITGYLGHELEAFMNIRAYRYILKPFDKEAVSDVMHRIIKQAIGQEIPKKQVILQEKGLELVLSESDIDYIEYNARTLLIHLSNESYQLYSYTLNRFMALLSDSFVRIHKSFIVNRTAIQAIDFKSNEVTLRRLESKVLPIGRSYKTNLRRIAI